VISRCILIKRDGTIYATLALCQGGHGRRKTVWMGKRGRGVIQFETLQAINIYAAERQLKVTRKTVF
jgi:hypothetical protein